MIGVLGSKIKVVQPESMWSLISVGLTGLLQIGQATAMAGGRSTKKKQRRGYDARGEEAKVYASKTRIGPVVASTKLQQWMEIEVQSQRFELAGAVCTEPSRPALVVASPSLVSSAA